MFGVRRRLIRQIMHTASSLYMQKSQLKQYKNSLSRYRLNHRAVTLGALLIPALWFGWKMGKGKWTYRIAGQLMDVAAVTFVGYFRTQLLSFLTQSAARRSTKNTHI